MGDRPQDEQLLIDYVLGKCDEISRQQVEERLGADKDFAQLHLDISRTFGALERYSAPEPPANLLERTMAKVRASRSSEALLKVQPVARTIRMPMFSLRELSAIAAALLLMAGILLPTLRQASRMRDMNTCALNQGQIGTALGQYAGEHNENLPASAATGEAWLDGADARVASNSAGMFGLVPAGYVAPSAFQCPAVGGQAFAVAAGMSDFPTARNVSYSYQHSLAGPLNRANPALRDRTREMAILADATPVFVNGVFTPERVHRAVSENHPTGAQNVLYLDMHVATATSANVGVDGNNIWLVDGVTNYKGTERPAGASDSFLLPNVIHH
jgi:hypothetical protein